MTTTLTNLITCPNCGEDSLASFGTYEAHGGEIYCTSDRRCSNADECGYADWIIDGILVGEGDDNVLAIGPVSSFDEALHAVAVATDTVIAEISGKIATERQYKARAIDTIARAERVNADRVAKGLEPMDRPYGIDIAREQYRVLKCDEKIAALYGEMAPFNEVYERYHWSRFFLVLNNNGHIHSSTSCSTCFITTDFGWLPELSGLTEADAVEQQGEILCSVCFPSAPVAWTSGTSKASKDAKAEREAAKAERLAKKREKALVPEDIDNGLLVVTGEGKYDREWIRTISAAKSWLTNAAAWGFNHPSYPPDAVDLVARVLAVRIDSTTEAEIEAAKKRAAKRR